MKSDQREVKKGKKNSDVIRGKRSERLKGLKS